VNFMLFIRYVFSQANCNLNTSYTHTISSMSDFNRHPADGAVLKVPYPNHRRNYVDRHEPFVREGDNTPYKSASQRLSDQINKEGLPRRQVCLGCLKALGNGKKENPYGRGNSKCLEPFR